MEQGETEVPTPTPQQPLTPSEHADNRIAAEALRKIQRGETPTATELAAIRRFEKSREEKKRWEYYRSIPKKHWQEMSGRQQKVINEQAERYNLPLGGPTINLEEFCKAFHDFLASNSRALASTGDDEGLPAIVGDREARKRIERAKASQEEIKLAEMQKRLVDRDQLRASLSELTLALRQGLEHLGKTHGAEAMAIMSESVDEWADGLDKFFGAS